MSKIIVNKEAIPADPKLALVKAFRIANKRAGEAKVIGDRQDYLRICERLQLLSDQAEELGFHLWVNPNGKTGHTYDKDYKPTPDEDNDFEAFSRFVESYRQQIRGIMGLGDFSNN